MDRVLCQELWPERKKIWKGLQKRAAVAYVSDNSKIRFGKNDVRIVDASDTYLPAARHQLESSARWPYTSSRGGGKRKHTSVFNRRG